MNPEMNMHSCQDRPHHRQPRAYHMGHLVEAHSCPDFQPSIFCLLPEYLGYQVWIPSRLHLRNT